MNQQLPQETYVDRILANLAAYPDREAIVDDDQRISYAQARSSVLRMAEAMREQGVGKGDTVAILTANRAEGVLLPLAIHVLGARLVTIPPLPALGEQHGFITRAEVDALVINPAIGRAVELARLAAPRLVLTLGPADLGEDLYDLMEKQPGILPSRATQQDVTSLFYTGGTTGRPKMVLHQHSYYLALMMASARRKAECPVPQRFLTCTLLDHTSGHISAMVTLLAEGTVVMPDHFEAGRVIELMRREKITSIGMVPPMLYELLDHPSLPAGGFPDLVKLHYGGGPATSARIQQALNRFGPVLRQAYGLTEVPVIALLEVEEHDPSIPGRLTAAGKPLMGMGERGEIAMLDPGGTEVPRGNIGEVCIRGPLVMTEYFKDPEKTAEVIRDGWLHTGDLGRWDDDGFIHLVDRLRDMIITGQNSDNVYSSLLEDALAKHPGIRMAAVVGLPDEAHGETVHAICVADPAVSVDADDIRKHAVDTLGPLYQPRSVTFTDALPWTPLGKIDKKALRRMLLDGTRT